MAGVNPLLRIGRWVNDLPMRGAIAFVLLLGLAIPAVLIVIFDVDARRGALERADEAEGDRIATFFATAATSGLDPAALRRMAETALSDARLTAIRIDRPGGQDLLVERLERREAGAPIRFIAPASVELNRSQVAAETRHWRDVMLISTLIQACAALVLTLWLLHYKVLRPLNALARRAGELAHRLDSPALRWRRHDELGEIGRALENVRGTAVTALEALDRRNAELAEGEERLSAIVSAHPMPLVVTAIDSSEFLFVSPAARKLFDPDERLVPPFGPPANFYADPVQRDAIMEAVARSGRADAVEIEFRRSDGSTFWAAASIRITSLQERPVVIMGLYDLTERRRIEGALRGTEAQLRLILDTMPDGIALFDARRRHIFVNRPYAEMFKSSPTEITGRALADLIEPALFEMVAAESAPALAGQIAQVGGWLDGFAGRSLYLERVYAPYQSSTGSAQGYFVIVRDRTAEMLARREADDVNRMFEAVLRFAPLFLHIKDRDRRYCMVSDHFLETWGTDRETLIGQTAEEAFPERVHAPVNERDREVLETGRRLPFYEVSYEDVNGRSISQWSTKVPIIGVDGKPSHVMTVGADVSDMKRVKAQLAATEAVKMAISDYSLDCIITIDEDGRVVEFNPAAELTFGYMRDQALGERLSELIIPAPERPRHEEGMRRYLETGERHMLGRRIQLDAIHADGSTLPIEMSITEVWAFDKRYFTAHARDIRELKESEAQRAHLEAQLRQSQKMEAMGTLAGGIAHDFNNVLATIQGSTEMVLDATPEDHPSRRSVERIMRATQRAKALVDQILTFSRPVQRHAGRVRLDQVAADAVQILREELPPEIELAAHFEDGSEVEADAGQLVQVLLNLGMNASHAMPMGGVLSMAIERVELDASAIAALPLAGGEPPKPGSYLRLAVTDNGHGMSPETLERVFDPFFTTKPSGRGTGLGLSMAHGIILSHGGAISAASRLGEGTEFSIYLPRATEAVAVPAGPILIGAGKRVLLVDDETDVREVGAEMLGALGFETETAESGVAALAIVTADPERFCLVITDHQMPDMSGLGLAIELAESAPSLPLLLLSGHAAKIAPESLRGTNIMELVGKPLSRREFAAAISRTLAGGSTERAIALAETAARRAGELSGPALR